MSASEEHAGSSPADRNAADPGAGDPDPGDMGADLRMMEAETAFAAAERLTFFTDAVVAIAITLLALDLPVPTGATASALVDSIDEDAFDFLAFFISFLVIGNHWRTHHRVFRHVRRAEGRVVTLDLAWLLLIVLNPFLTRVLSGGELNIVTFGMYAVAQALQLIVFAAMMITISRRGWFAPTAPESLTTRGQIPSLIIAGGFLVSIPIFLVAGPWAFAVWFAVPFGMGRLERRLKFVPHD